MVEVNLIPYMVKEISLLPKKNKTNLIEQIRQEFLGILSSQINGNFLNYRFFKTYIFSTQILDQLNYSILKMNNKKLLKSLVLLSLHLKLRKMVNSKKMEEYNQLLRQIFKKASKKIYYHKSKYNIE